VKVGAHRHEDKIKMPNTHVVSGFSNVVKVEADCSYLLTV
jgi:hypothetical protein